MDAFKRVDSRFDQLSTQLEEVKDFLGLEIWDAAQTTSVTKLKLVGSKYRRYMDLQKSLQDENPSQSCKTTVKDKVECTVIEDMLIDNFKNLYEYLLNMKGFIAGTAPKLADAKPNRCNSLVQYKAHITFITASSFDAHRLGCLLLHS